MSDGCCLRHVAKLASLCWLASCLSNGWCLRHVAQARSTAPCNIAACLQVLSEAFGELQDASFLQCQASMKGSTRVSHVPVRPARTEHLAPAGPDSETSFQSQPAQSQAQAAGPVGQGGGRISSLLRHACCLGPAMSPAPPHHAGGSHNMRARPAASSAAAQPSKSAHDNGGALDGVLFWNLAAPTYEDFDGERGWSCLLCC